MCIRVYIKKDCYTLMFPRVEVVHLCRQIDCFMFVFSFFQPKLLSPKLSYIFL